MAFISFYYSFLGGIYWRMVFFWREAFIGINTVPIVLNPALKHDYAIKLIFMPACVEDTYPTLIPLPRDL